MKMFLALALSLVSSAALASNVCREGDQQRWPSQDPRISNSGGEGAPVDVLWVCHNGGYVEVGYRAPVQRAPKKCTEGELHHWPSQDPMNSQTGESGPIDVPWVCRNGRFIELYASPVRTPSKPIRCKEGQIERFETNSGEGGPVTVEVYVCRKGQFRLQSLTRY